jgi:hypothetical protein
MIENDLTHYCYATFILRGKGFNPDEVTSLIGINPSWSFKRGDWRTKTEKWRHNFWSLSSKGEVQSDDLSIHIQWLINQLESKIDKLLEIKKQNGVEGEISCFWILPTNHENLSISENVIGQIASLGIKLSVDIYGPD